MKKRVFAVRMAISAVLLAVFLSSCPLFGFVESFRILKPMQGENTGTNRRPQFMWTALEDAVSYELQADDSASFDSIDYHWTGLIGTTFTPPMDMNVSVSPPVGTRYYFRVRSVDASGNVGGWRRGMFGERCVNVGGFDNDFNGDGYSDVLKGDGVFFGGSFMDGIEDLALNGVDGGIVPAGDVNGDGYCDVLTGNGIYFGGAVMDGDADLTLTVEMTGGDFGSAIASAGDVNADGYSDVIMGDGCYNNYQGKEVSWQNEDRAKRGQDSRYMDEKCNIKGGEIKCIIC